MNDIENIIKRYQQELLEFSSQNQTKSPSVVPVVSSDVEEAPIDETFVENSLPAIEQAQQYDYLQQYDTYDDFLSENSSNGLLRVQVFGGNQFFPIPGARVTVSLTLSNGTGVEQFDGLTDINGVVDNISLPAPPAALSQSPNVSEQRPFSYYTVEVEHPRYAASRFLNVPVFSDVKSVQNVQLVPLINSGSQPDTTVQLRAEPFLKLRGIEENGNTNRS